MSASTQTKGSLQVHQPRQGPPLPKPRPERILFVCHYEPTGVSTITETAAFFQTFSRFPITVLNMYEHRYSIGPVMFPPDVDLDQYTAILFHSTVTYNAENIYAIDRHTKRKLKEFAGLKILMKQDDNHKFRQLRPYIGEAGFDLVLTCLPPEAVSIVYPPGDVGHARFERMLTGYVTPTLRAIAGPSAPRPIDIGYRGSVMPLWFGRLCYDKHRIGTDVARLLAGRGLRLDISSRTEERLGSEAWFDFLLSCKATLGTASGASIFDLDGDLHERVAAIEGEIGPYQEGQAYAEAYLARLADLENVIDYGQVSPRHFEAAACRTLQILFPGRYSDILRPHDHYFPLAHNLSNLDEAVDLTRDEARRAAMADRAYEEIINDRSYWIEAFIARLDALILELAEAKGVLRPQRSSARPATRNVLVLTTQRSPGNNRWAWLRASAGGDLALHRICVGEWGPNPADAHAVGPWPLDWRLTASSWVAGETFEWAARFGDGAADALVRELCYIEGLLALDDARFARALHAPHHSPRLSAWRAHLGSILAITKSLVEAAWDWRGLHAVVASELRCLPAAAILSRTLGVPLIYDVSRCEPEADPHYQEFERQFLSDLEGRLVPEAALRVAASPELAGWLAERHGLEFEAIGCIPPPLPIAARPAAEEPRTVVLIASQAAEGLRGAVVEAWPDVRSGARLLLVREGPAQDGDREGHLGAGHLALNGARGTELTELIVSADIVVLAIDPAFTNDRVTIPAAIPLCLARGVPIIAHPAPALKSALAGADRAVLVNLRDRGRLVRLIDAFLAEPSVRDGLERSARSDGSQAWQRDQQTYYARLQDLLRRTPPGALHVFEPTVAGTAIPVVASTDDSTAPMPDPKGYAVREDLSNAPTSGSQGKAAGAQTGRAVQVMARIVRRLATKAPRRDAP